MINDLEVGWQRADSARSDLPIDIYCGPESCRRFGTFAPASHRRPTDHRMDRTRCSAGQQVCSPPDSARASFGGDCIQKDGQPKCPKCGGRLISSVVNFKDPMPEKEMGLSYYHSKNADIFLVVGSSLSVTPAAHMPLEAKQNGAKLIIINHMETGMDNLADLRFHENAGEILTRILTLI